MALSDSYLRIPLEQIHVPRSDRQRSQIEVSDILPSIRMRGVIQPIIVERSGEAFVLVAGERRIEASRQAGISDIPARLADELSHTERQIIELEENVKRQNLPWQDEALAYLKIHNLYCSMDPSWNQSKTAEAIGVTGAWISQNLQVAEEINKKNPRVLACTGPRAAYNIIARRNDRAIADVMNGFLTEPANERRDNNGNDNSPSSTVNADVGNNSNSEANTRSNKEETNSRKEAILNLNFHSFASEYSGPLFNFLHCDFPYGISHHQSDQGGSARWGGYEDSNDTFWDLCKTLCQYLDYLMAPSSHLMFWCPSDIERQYEIIQFFRQNAPSLEWQTVPLYWHKTDNKGIIPDPRRAPRRVVETALVAARGDRPIVAAVSNAYGSPTTKEIHQSEKPEPMLRHFFQMYVDSDTRMLDPTCGSATSIRAVESFGGEATGLEIDEEIVSAARVSLRKSRILRQHNEKNK